jgi:hypothetical protein
MMHMYRKMIVDFKKDLQKESEDVAKKLKL